MSHAWRLKPEEGEYFRIVLTTLLLSLHALVLTGLNRLRSLNTFLKVSRGWSVHLDEVEANGVVSLSGDWSSVMGDDLQALQKLALTSRKHIVTGTQITFKCSMIQLRFLLG